MHVNMASVVDISLSFSFHLDQWIDLASTINVANHLMIDLRKWTLRKCWFRIFSVYIFLSVCRLLPPFIHFSSSCYPFIISIYLTIVNAHLMFLIVNFTFHLLILLFCLFVCHIWHHHCRSHDRWFLLNVLLKNQKAIKNKFLFFLETNNKS